MTTPFSQTDWLIHESRRARTPERRRELRGRMLCELRRLARELDALGIPKEMTLAEMRRMR